MSVPQNLTELQLAILQILWDQGEAPVAHVHRILHKRRGLALTTVATVLARLHKKKLLRRRMAGRHYVYRPTMSPEDVRRWEVDGVTRRVFRGDVTALICHLISEGEIGVGELAQVKSTIRRKERILRKP